MLQRQSGKSPPFCARLQATGERVSTQAIATAKEVFELLRDDLGAIEKELVRDTVSNVGAITGIADYLREGGGKRIRPSLLLLAAKALGGRGKA